MKDTEEELPEIIDGERSGLIRKVLWTGIPVIILGVCIWWCIFQNKTDKEGEETPVPVHGNSREQDAGSLSGLKQEELIKKLDHFNAKVRLKAVKALSNSKSWTLLKPLVNKGLTDESRDVSKKTRKLIDAIISSPPDIPIEKEFARFIIINLLKGTPLQKVYTWSICKAMGKKAEGIVPEFINLLKDNKESDWARQEAARALGTIGSPAADKAIPDLVTAVKGTSPGVSVSAAFAIAQIGPPAAAEAVPDLILAMKEGGERVGYLQLALQNICCEDQESLEYLIDSIKHEDQEIRRGVVQTFTGFKPETAMQALQIITASLTDRNVQKEAVETLVAQGKKSEKIRDKLIEIYNKSKSYKVQEWMVQVFKQIGGEDMLEALVYTVIYGSKPLKREAAYALEELEDISVLADLQKALEDETDMNTKQAILRAVNKLKELKMDQDFKKAIKKEQEEKLKKSKQ